MFQKTLKHDKLEMKASGTDTVSILGVSDDRVKLDNDGLKKAPSKSETRCTELPN